MIGTGLIGTSIALALREHGAGVWLADEDPEAARRAVNLGAGEPLPEAAYADVAVIAVPPDAVAAIGAAMARGLAHAHSRGIVHRAVKPANVMTSMRGDVKIFDF